MGQKQLLCLTRVLLKRNKFLILDEATANVDMQTDELIQEIIREQFKQATIIAIAHRLHTIADYDRVIVLQKGRVAEQGSPLKLIQANGLFSQMVMKTGKMAKTITKKAQLQEQKIKKVR